jgi:bifunctional enzyme CysN/CysC
MNEAGLMCITAFLAPSEEVRVKGRDLVGAERFIVVHLDAPIEVCRTRDAAGQYKKADEGRITHFPGVSFPYEPPVNPDLVLKTDQESVSGCFEKLLVTLKQRTVFG